MNRIMTIALAFAMLGAVSSSVWAWQDADNGPSAPSVAPTNETPPNSAKFQWQDLMVNKSPGVPTTQDVKGTLAIQAVQGTPGGRPIGAAEVRIDLHHRGALLDTINVELDEHGVAFVENIPVAMGVQPTVSVMWADLSYQVTGSPMDMLNNQQKLEVVCYEPTDQKPPWKVLMRHVMISPAAEGFAVTEVMVIENPDHRTWIGEKAGISTKRNTTVFVLPTGAQDVKLGRGFHDWCCSTLNKNLLVNHLPLMPESTQMIFSYLIPMKKGAATVEITAPAQSEHTMVIIPDSLKTERVVGLEPGGTQSMGDESMRQYMASQQATGEKVSITLATVRPAGPAVAATTSATLAKVAALVGGGVVMLIALVIVFSRKPKSNKASASADKKSGPHVPTFEI